MLTPYHALMKYLILYRGLSSSVKLICKVVITKYALVSLTSTRLLF